MIPGFAINIGFGKFPDYHNCVIELPIYKIKKRYRTVNKCTLPKLDVSHINAQNTPTLAEKKLF